MDTNNKPGFWRKTGEALGLVERSSVPSVASYPGRQAYTQAGTTGNALTIAGIYRAITIHTTAAAQLSVKAYRGGRIAALPSFVRRPNVNGQLSQFIETTMRSLLLDGNAYWFVERDANDAVINLEVLNPNAMEIGVVNGQLQYHYSYDHGKTVQFTASQIQHLAINKDGFSLKGAGPIQYARRSIEGMLDQREYADNWFKRSGVPNGYLSNDGNPMNPQATFDQWMQYLEERGTATGVLTGGWKYNLIALNPADAMWIEAQQFSVTEIARWFGVPPTYLLAAVDGSTNTYSNMEQVDTAYVRLSLMQYLIKIEEAFTSLAKGTLVIKFDTSGLLRADQATRFANHAVALSSDFMTINEVRALEGLAPVPGGDELRGSKSQEVQPVDGNSVGDQNNANE